MRASLFGTYDGSHPANRLLADALRAAGVTLETCHEPLWEHTRDKTARFFSVGHLARLGVAYLGAAWRLRRTWRRRPRPDFVVTGFNGQLDVILARFVAGRRARLVFAPLVTLTETLVEDRAVYPAGGVRAWLVRVLDRVTLECADLVLLDSDAHRAYVASALTPRARTATLHLGAEAFFVPTPARVRSFGEPLRVLFYGQYLPLHGAPVIAEAAARLGVDAGIQFTMIGAGPERAEVERRVRGCAHVRFEDWASYAALPDRLRDCDVALGVFGTGVKADMVVATKVYQAAASGRAIVTGEATALREVFTPEVDLLTVPRGDAGALASALVRLQTDPELTVRLGAAAAARMRARLDGASQGARLRGLLRETFADLGDAVRPGAAQVREP